MKPVVESPRWRVGWLLLAGATFLATGLALLAAEAKPMKRPEKPVPTTVEIRSTPPGALVMGYEGTVFDRHDAPVLGKTPMLRLYSLPTTGVTIRVSKPGFQPWLGFIQPGAGTLHAELTPLSDEQKQECGWFQSPPSRRLVVVPVRIGIHKLGKHVADFQTGEHANDFTNRFWSTFAQTIHGRFGENGKIRDDTALSDPEFWRQLEDQVKSNRMDTVGFEPAPTRLKFAPAIESSLASLDGAVLLVRAEAFYQGAGVVFAKGVATILMTAGSAAGGYYGAQASGASYYTYQVHGPPPAKDVILVQMFLVHSGTRELMWFGQAVTPAYFKSKNVVEQTAGRAAEQVPAPLIKIVTASP